MITMILLTHTVVHPRRYLHYSIIGDGQPAIKGRFYQITFTCSCMHCETQIYWKGCFSYFAMVKTSTFSSSTNRAVVL